MSMSRSEFLRERNARWACLREVAERGAPGQAEFEAALQDLRALIGWSRAQVLAGLGLHPDNEPIP
ncbi:hypothetical protein [Deinococcus maricopensis]